MESIISREKLIYCICPYCNTSRKKISKKFNIIKKGYERNGLARFYCTPCTKWFNERTGDTMRWYNQIN